MKKNKDVCKRTEETNLLYNLARSEIRDIQEYNPGPMPDDLVRISANENNLGVSPLAIEAMKEALVYSNRYPDSTCTVLREALGRKFGLSAENFVVSNGLDGIFTMLGRAFINKGDEVITAGLTFSVYKDMTDIMGGVCVEVPMTENMKIDCSGIVKKVTGKTKMIFFCNPNNPTGRYAELSEIEDILKKIPENVIFVLDEAYIEFSEKCKSGISLLNKYNNLVICRTFSKLYGLAGARVGYVIASPEFNGYLYKVREPYCVSRVSVAGAVAALGDNEYIEKTKKLIARERIEIISFLREMNFDVYESEANFVFFFTEKAQKIRKSLFKQGIVVRALSYNGRKALRISVGTTEENRLLISAIKSFCSEWD